MPKSKVKRVAALTDAALDVINDILYVARLRMIGNGNRAYAILWSFEEHYTIETINRTCQV